MLGPAGRISIVMFEDVKARGLVGHMHCPVWRLRGRSDDWLLTLHSGEDRPYTGMIVCCNTSVQYSQILSFGTE